ncbi:MAG: YdbL family protein [Zoogloeaceae bacterium]|jgi:hypothetical protein|nr:YdbL family protein [Zoogloeaceae bacterium]
MNRHWLRILALALALAAPVAVEAQTAQPDFKVNAPAVNALRDALKLRFQQLKPYLESGALGVGAEGNVVLRDPAVVPLNQRQGVKRLLAEQERDGKALFREIARANGHPEWEEDIARTFSERMKKRRDKLPAGWWLQDADGSWRQSSGG